MCERERYPSAGTPVDIVNGASLGGDRDSRTSVPSNEWGWHHERHGCRERKSPPQGTMPPRAGDVPLWSTSERAGRTGGRITRSPSEPGCQSPQDPPPGCGGRSTVADAGGANNAAAVTGVCQSRPGSGGAFRRTWQRRRHSLSCRRPYASRHGDGSFQRPEVCRLADPDGRGVL